MLFRRTRARGRRAGAAIELAAMLPFLAYIVVIGTDWARLFYYTITIEGCARAGALYAADRSRQGETQFTSTTDAAIKSAPNLTPTPTVTETTKTVDGRQIVVVTVTMNFKTITNFPGVPSNNTITRIVEMRVFPTAMN
jgi:Flp pilus assembly protein TadG